MFLVGVATYASKPHSRVRLAVRWQEKIKYYVYQSQYNVQLLNPLAVADKGMRASALLSNFCTVHVHVLVGLGKQSTLGFLHFSGNPGLDCTQTYVNMPLGLSKVSAKSQMAAFQGCPKKRASTVHHISTPLCYLAIFCHIICSVTVTLAMLAGIFT